jgi:hypothetical protein
MAIFYVDRLKHTIPKIDIFCVGRLKQPTLKMSIFSIGRLRWTTPKIKDHFRSFEIIDRHHKKNLRWHHKSFFY